MRSFYLSSFLFLITGLIFGLEAAQAYEINVNGANGQDGSIERNYSTSPGASQGNGSDGSHANRSTKGSDAGKIEINLKDISAPGQASQVQITGNKITADGSRISINQTQDFGSGQVLRLSAKGGRGGDGGHGGDGEGGCNGDDGRDAYHRTRATRGEDGCDGGNGGNGTPGSNGGNGGIIIVNVSIEDVHLLRSIQIDVDAGSGGDRGRNGEAGRGGRGGDGGDGDRWREKTGTRSVRVSYTDYESDRDCNLERQGDGSYENVCRTIRVPVTKYRTEYEDVYEWFTTPGASDGSNGSSGHSGNGNISAGNRGQNGNYVFNVIYPNNKKEQYQKPFQLKILSYDVVEDEKTRNGIFEPGEIIHLENITVANIGDAPSPNGNAKVFTNLKSSSLEIIEERLEIPSLKKGEHHTFRKKLSLRIPEDSQIGSQSAVEILHNIKPGATIDKTRTRLIEFPLEKAIHARYPVVLTFFDVPEVMAPGEKLPLMIKIKNISNQNLGSERQMESRVGVRGGDTPADDISFSNLSWAIESLDAGETILLESFITLSDDTPAYTGFNVQTGLFMEKLGDEENTLIQQQLLEIKVAQKYRYSSDAQILLITNCETTRDEYNAWMSFARELGIKMDIWDLGYYGSLSLGKSLESGSSLMDNYRNKTVLFIKSNSDDTQAAIRSIRANDFLAATQQNNINFLFIGGSEKENQSLINQYLNTTALVAGEHTSEVDNGFFSSLFTSFRQRQGESIDRFNRELLDSNPNQRFIIETRDDKTLVARPALGIRGGQAYTLSFSEREIHSPNFIRSDEMKRAVLLPLTFNSKLDLLDQKFSHEVKDAALFDLIHEITLADQGKERTDGARVEVMSSYLSLLNRLQATQNKNHFNYLVAGALEYAQLLDTKYLRNKIKDDLKKFENEGVKNLRAEMQSQAEERIKHLPGLSERDNLKNMLTLPAVHRVYSTEQLQDENIMMENL